MFFLYALWIYHHCRIPRLNNSIILINRDEAFTLSNKNVSLKDANQFCLGDSVAWDYGGVLQVGNNNFISTNNSIFQRWSIINWRMQVHDLDVFTLSKQSFTVRKTTSYFTLPTILLSLAIIVTAFLLSMDTLEHLWLSRADLPIFSSQKFSYPAPLSSTLVCYRDNTLSKTLPSARILNTEGQPLAFSFYSQEDIYESRPQLAAKMESNFGCYDIAGFTYSATNVRIRVEVDSRNTTLFIEAKTDDQIVYLTESQLIEVESRSYGQQRRSLRILEAILHDTLMLNAPMQLVSTYYYDPASFLTYTVPKILNYSRFALEFLTPRVEDSTLSELNAFNIKTLSITRNDLGFIVGTVLSWISSLTLVASFVIGPLVQKSFAFIQIKYFFHVPPQYQKPSLLRYIIASFKSGLFPKEDIYVKLEQKLEPLKDIELMLKLNKTLRTICHSNKASFESETFASGEAFISASGEQFQEPSYVDDKEERLPPFETASDTPKEEKSVTMRRECLKWLDVGSDSITLNFSRKYGSLTSIILTIFFIGGFIAFLVYFGVLQLTTAVLIYDLNPVEPIYYEFKRNEIMFASFQNSEVLVSLYDENYNEIESLTLVSSPQCLQGLNQHQVLQLTQLGKYYYCFAKEFTLMQSSMESISLYVDNSNFIAANLAVFHFSAASDSREYRPINNPIILVAIQGEPAIYYEQTVTLTTIVDADANSTTYASFRPVKKADNSLCSLKGLNIVLRNKVTFIETTSSSLFDLLQTVWGMATVCFAVLLAKAAKYINSNVRVRKETAVKTEFRDNLGILLSKVSSLRHGRQRKQLSKLRYYLKRPLHQSSSKFV